ncbi:hypothetical protein [Shouchella clausii]|uniref:hypothetical protein n=1 Tax=Shouchella clausii TaxID=79880 RepID=UPI000BA7DB3C|nr:hypothetical protein [Shouchella clausii]PAD91088.1 hypothetical protein CHH52_16765 [Shouchella clausii]
MKRHTLLIIAGFLLFGALVGGGAGAGLRYLFHYFWADGQLRGGDLWVAAAIAAVPGMVASVYWGYFYHKKERNETKHLH